MNGIDLYHEIYGQGEPLVLIHGGLTTIVPGYSHYNFITSPEVPQIVDRFLADPLAHAGGGVAASQAG